MAVSHPWHVWGVVSTSGRLQVAAVVAQGRVGILGVGLRGQSG